jgi:hypothetical protein
MAAVKGQAFDTLCQIAFIAVKQGCKLYWDPSETYTMALGEGFASSSV